MKSTLLAALRGLRCAGERLASAPDAGRARAPGTSWFRATNPVVTRGTVPFTPVNPLAAARTTEANVQEDGGPRADLAALHHRLALPPRPGAVKHASAKRTATEPSITSRARLPAHDHRRHGDDRRNRNQADEHGLRGPPAGTLVIRITLAAASAAVTRLQRLAGHDPYGLSSSVSPSCAS